MAESSDQCIFCMIAAGQSPAQIEYQDDEIVAFWDVQPAAPVHVLIVPRKHLMSLSHTTSEDTPLLGKMLHTARDIAHSKGLEEDGYRVVINNGSDSGQVVDHLHFHLLGGTPLGPMTNAKTKDEI